tara:strand:- start:8290 stop:9129 length:840 start_codon:yes stop_codon:yes gene_type:complete
MKIDKKYLVVNGCSFSEGHNLGTDGAWPRYLGEYLNMEVVNLSHGGGGNDTIVSNLRHYGDINKDIAEDSFFILQLTECLRYSVSIELGDEIIPHVFTPLQFMYGDRKFKDWNMDSPVNKWVYDNRYALAPIFVNITERLYNTYNLILNMVNWFESNNYPYLIFDGINNHIPVLTSRGNWVLEGSNPNHESFGIEVCDINPQNNRDFSRYSITRGIPTQLINQIKNLKYYYKDKIFLRELDSKQNIDGIDYTKGNDGHPNKKGAQMWAKHLLGVIDGLD